MKKNLFFALMGAIALTGTVGFSACTSSDDIAEQNPTYDPVKNEVTTQFVLNIASSDMKETRQSAATVQKNDNFRGMQDAVLIGLSTGNYTNEYLAPFLGSSVGFEVISSYDLGTLYGPNAVDNDNAEDPEAENPTNSVNRNSSSRRVVELTLPLKTDAMLVYGRAVPDENDNGQVTIDIDKTAPEKTTFSLVSRLGDESSDSYKAYTQTCNLAALILNRVMRSEKGITSYNASDPIIRDADDDPETTDDIYIQKGALPALKWREIGSLSDAGISALAPLQQNLAIAYKTIADTYRGNDIHSGSSNSITTVIKDVYAIASTVASATATDDDELNAQLLADRIRNVIGYYFNTTSFTFKDLGTVSNLTGDDKEDYPIYHLVNTAGIPQNEFQGNGAYAKVTSSYLRGIPTAFNLPEGVAQLEFSEIEESSGGFVYKSASDNNSLINISETLNPTKYTYPAELLYFDNSLLRVNDLDKEPTQYPNGYNKWDTDSWSGWNIGPVASTTRSVAVKNNINYGVAMLKTLVALQENEDAFLDNRPAGENVSLSADEVSEFTLTGVLVGGQYKQLGWNYLQDATASSNNNFVIYDNLIAGTGAIPTTTYPNYTLVFDNYKSGDTQDPVRVALEFKNGNDKDIYGIGGMIPKGGTFYLVGELKIADATEASKTITWPETYAIPPYTNSGASQEVTRIFIQDFVTTATFTIGEESLKHAYTTVPDLRASQTSLGLSVDLNWRPGLEFTDVSLGQ